MNRLLTCKLMATLRIKHRHAWVCLFFSRMNQKAARHSHLAIFQTGLLWFRCCFSWTVHVLGAWSFESRCWHGRISKIGRIRCDPSRWYLHTKETIFGRTLGSHRKGLLGGTWHLSMAPQNMSHMYLCALLTPSISSSPELGKSW